MDIIKKAIQPVVVMIITLLAVIGYITTGQQILLWGVPGWAWQASGAILFLAFILSLVKNQEKKLINSEEKLKNLEEQFKNFGKQLNKIEGQLNRLESDYIESQRLKTEKDIANLLQVSLSASNPPRETVGIESEGGSLDILGAKILNQDTGIKSKNSNTKIQDIEIKDE